ncbi:uncharacterized protein LOC108701745 [Xenopus laevis]|uniref:Uncharacterized protein LOC108701745 n=2 Tax=Xenopus laevis TaxID=8355 RepID=A0A1L8EZB8_XENLA|nr:uncharacterized protein LOC108701745 [Xenopus laevis]XP_041433018.1 uncharacterized protein LOC108701745 [Xenopus laevis]OCT64702.1 hypothetical protein XELAEV_18045799mg [Xenopus laevis]
MTGGQIKKPLLGIFSRVDQTKYQWLIESAHSSVPDIRPVHIANDSGQNFREEVPKCTIAILYHTVNRGRLNLTNIKDSLYDNELQILHDMLGKENVIVVIDDLEDSNSAEKDRILNEQPSLRRLARDVFLFSTKEKERIPLGNQKKKKIPDPKVEQLIKIIKDHHQRKQCYMNVPCAIGTMVIGIVFLLLFAGVLIYSCKIPLH